VRPLDGVLESVTFPLPKGLDGAPKIAPIGGAA